MDRKSVAYAKTNILGTAVRVAVLVIMEDQKYLATTVNLALVPVILTLEIHIPVTP